MRSPKRICNHAGCMALTTEGRCAKHKREPWKERRKTERYRGSAHSRGYTAQWTELSITYRAQHPLCVMCANQSKIEPATCVDHIIPIRCAPDLAMDWDNLQSACNRCNSRKRTDTECACFPGD